MECVFPKPKPFLLAKASLWFTRRHFPFANKKALPRTNSHIRFGLPSSLAENLLVEVKIYGLKMVSATGFNRCGKMITTTIGAFVFWKISSSIHSPIQNHENPYSHAYVQYGDYRAALRRG